MQNKRMAFVVLVLGFFVFTAVAHSAEHKKGVKDSLAAATDVDQKEDQGFDIILLMDSSGSMKKTDPRSYRKDAARLFISLLEGNDRAGLISFGDAVKTLIPLTPNTKNNRTAFSKAVNKITSKEFSTDITGAVKRGFEELQFSKRKNRVLILMSDGKLALGDARKDEASLEELMKLLPELNKAAIKVYTIAFSELSDSKLLSDMADKTGGFFRYAATDKDIHIMFASIFEKIKSPDSVALQGDAFTIDGAIREAILLITKTAGTTTVLIDPSGKKHIQGKSAKNIKWYSSNIFDMITVQEPTAGKWKVRLSSREGNRIFVLTNLKLKSSFEKNALTKGDKVVIDAWIEKDDKRITEKEVLDQIIFSADVIGPDHKSLKIPLTGKAAPDEGIYAGELTLAQSGDYMVKLSAEGKTFNRTKDILFKSVEPSAPPAVAAQVQRQTPERAIPPSRGAEQIDWEKTLLLAGITDITLIALAVFLFVWGRRYKALYLAALSENSGLPPKEPVESVENTETVTAEEKEQVAAIEEKPEIPGIAKEPAILEVAAQAEAVLTDARTGSNGPLADKAGPESERIKKLLGIIDFQKKIIAELMLVKDMLENARMHLGALPQRNKDQQAKVKAIAESHGLMDEVGSSVSALQDDTSKLVSYIMVLEKEESRLAEKFRQWEEELNRLLAGEEYIPTAILVEPGQSAGQTAELEAKITEMEDALMAKERKMKALEQQYEDIEKEYMILYHAQQKQKQK